MEDLDALFDKEKEEKMEKHRKIHRQQDPTHPYRERLRKEFQWWPERKCLWDILMTALSNIHHAYHPDQVFYLAEIKLGIRKDDELYWIPRNQKIKGDAKQKAINSLNWIYRKPNDQYISCNQFENLCHLLRFDPHLVRTPEYLVRLITKYGKGGRDYLPPL